MMKYWRIQDIGYTGVAFPFTVDDRGCVRQCTVDHEAGIVETIRQAIIQICLTVKGSRFFNRSFGAAPIWILFRHNTPEEMALIRSEIEDFLLRWEPRARLTQFEVVYQYESIAIIKLGYEILQSQLQGFVEVQLPLVPGG